MIEEIGDIRKNFRRTKELLIKRSSALPQIEVRLNRISIVVAVEAAKSLRKWM